MGFGTRLLLGATLIAAIGLPGAADEPHTTRESTVSGPGGLKLTVRMQGPYDAEVPPQVVCHFKHKPAGDKTSGAPVELDKRLGGVIAALRDRGEFAGDELETILLTPPEGAIRSGSLLLIGLGDEKSMPLERMERVDRVAVREAMWLGAKRVASPR